MCATRVNEKEETENEMDDEENNKRCMYSEHVQHSYAWYDKLKPNFVIISPYGLPSVCAYACKTLPRVDCWLLEYKLTNFV